jgi:hypothetical protein
LTENLKYAKIRGQLKACILGGMACFYWLANVNKTTNMRTKYIIGALVLAIAMFLLWPTSAPVVSDNSPPGNNVKETSAKAPLVNKPVIRLSDGSIVVHERARFALAPAGSRPPTNMMSWAEFQKLSRRQTTNVAGNSQ